MSQDYEAELTATREEVAGVLSGVTDGILAGSVRLGDGADAVSVGVPDELTLEIEVETDEDGVSVELEAEWPHADAGTAADEGSAAGGDARGPADASDGASGGSEDAVDIPAVDDPAVTAGADDGSASLARFELFRDRRDEWRWRLRHRNGNVIATGGEGYTRKHNARKGLGSVVANAPGADITEE